MFNDRICRFPLWGATERYRGSDVCARPARCLRPARSRRREQRFAQNDQIRVCFARGCMRFWEVEARRMGLDRLRGFGYDVFEIFTVFTRVVAVQCHRDRWMKLSNLFFVFFLFWKYEDKMNFMTKVNFRTSEKTFNLDILVKIKYCETLIVSCNSWTLWHGTLQFKIRICIAFEILNLTRGCGSIISRIEILYIDFIAFRTFERFIVFVRILHNLTI